MNQKEIDWQKNFHKNPQGGVNKPSSLRDEHNIVMKLKNLHCDETQKLKF